MITAAYRLEYRQTGREGTHTIAWEGYGRPTGTNLAHFIKAFNRSHLPGHANGHLSLSAQRLLVVNWAQIVSQRTEKVLATYSAPAFEVIETE